MAKIVSETIVEGNPGEWYGTLVTSGIKYDNGSRLTVQSKLYAKFLAPHNTGVQPLVSLTPWQQVTCTLASEPMDDGTVAVTAELQIAGPYTFTPSDTLKWGINGDLRGDASKYTSSFELYADELPSGTVEVNVPDAPDGALSNSTQTVILTKGGVSLALSAEPGRKTSFPVATGKYKVEVDELVNDNETVAAAAAVSPTEITVEEDSNVTLTVSYGAIKKFSGLDIKVGQLSSPLDRERIHVEVRSGSDKVNEFDSPNNRTTSLRRLPASGTATINAALTFNNTKYTSEQSVTLSNALIGVDIGSDKFSSADIDTSSFVDLPIDRSGESVTLRLVSKDRPAFIYSKEVSLNSGTITLGIPVAQGKYAVKATGYIKDGTVYAAQVADEIVISSDGSSKIHLQIVQGPNLLVRGFPDYLSFGALSDLVDLEGKDLTAAKVSSVFKYAGDNGAGDAGGYLDDDPATTKTVKLAALVSENLGGQPVLPVMISYTVNLSGGDSETHLLDESGLEHSFGNLILSMQLAKKASENKVTAGYIVNPDFLGANEQDKRSPDFSMPVVAPLTKALAHRNVDAAVPSTITNTLAGYVQAVNWLIRTAAPEVTFGWQVNLWGVGSSAWIYDKTDADVATPNAKTTAAYVRSLGAYDGPYAPDFLAIDRFEADDFTERAYTVAYCYGPREWARFYGFAAAVAMELKVPVMPWQIPASRVPRAADDAVTPGSLERDQWGTGGTYLFGDAGVGSEVGNMHPVVRGIRPAAIVGQDSVEALFRGAGPFDLGAPAWGDFPLRGIFAVLLGGGSTTGVVGSIGTTGAWTQGRIREYMASPVPLTSTPR
ncbi:hypothetical protein KVR01_011867 [Diaporthe batatas]|uniref:uncharacterized protein n=1 Tax=Diaporthe batatas TaxID=748121 RepID=UPI001D0369C6|nr:uncharacterized protein KVR01_011867 [Diaporthe batatas]KAG8158106.1 hypothetical protein KVR01_011867 [Diaporthe batatas]